MASQVSLFDMGDGQSALEDPHIPDCEPWSQMECLKFEKEMIGFWLSGHPLDMFRETIKTFVNFEIKEFKSLEEHIDKEICFAGVIVSIKKGVNKNGNPYSSFVIEDASGSYEFFLNGKKYVAYGDFCKENIFVLIKAVIKPAWKDNTKLEVQIEKMELLEDVVDKYIDSISLSMSISRITEGNVKTLSKVCKKAKGKTKLNITVIDDEDSEIALSMKSKKVKVNAEKFVEELKKESSLSNCISYRFNKMPF
jgi:DNA polymerase-3 subunit alpha